MKLALFFTTGVSLDIWNRTGMLAREIKPYNRLAKVFEKIYFFTYGDKTDLQYAKFLEKNIVIVPKRINLPSKLYSLFLPLLNYKIIKDADILKTNQMYGAWAAVLAKWLFGKKLVVRCGYQWSLSAIGWKMGFIKRMVVSLIERISYRAADFIIITSDSSKSYIIKQYKITDNKIAVLPNYVDTDLFKPTNAPKIQNSVVFVGRLEEDKNLMSLFEAVDGTGAVLTIFGSGSQKNELKNYAEEHGLKVDFRNNIANNQLPDELNRHQIFVLPSLYEGNPKALLEAMACGLAVIGSDVRGINEVIQHKKNGLLCNSVASSLRAALLNLFDDSTLRTQLGEAARNYVENNCGLDKIIGRENEIYLRLVGSIKQRQ